MKTKTTLLWLSRTGRGLALISQLAANQRLEKHLTHASHTEGHESNVEFFISYQPCPPVTFDTCHLFPVINVNWAAVSHHHCCWHNISHFTKSAAFSKCLSVTVFTHNHFMSFLCVVSFFSFFFFTSLGHFSIYFPDFTMTPFDVSPWISHNVRVGQMMVLVWSQPGFKRDKMSIIWCYSLTFCLTSTRGSFQKRALWQSCSFSVHWHHSAAVSPCPWLRSSEGPVPSLLVAVCERQQSNQS